MYKLNKSSLNDEITSVQKIQDGRLICIPFDPANTDYQAYLKWVAEGNEPEPSDE